MRKTYRYKNLEYAVADDQPVNFTVTFVSDGNTAQTVVNIPGDDDPSIKDEGTVSLGKGENLREEKTVIFTDLANLIPEEDHVKVDYKINGEVIVSHENPKSEEERPYIVLIIKFTEQ